jgi:competence protein CoiA
VKIALTASGQSIEINQADKNETYFCPFCQQPMLICGGEYKQKYFAHQQNKSKRGSGAGETNRHLHGKQALIEFFKQRAVEVQTEMYLPAIKRRADIAVQTPSKTYIIEYQCSPIRLAEIKERTQAYRQLGLISYWIAGPKHVKQGSLFQTVQKFGRYNQQKGWWFLTWDALSQPVPELIYQIKRQALGKIIFQKRNLMISQKHSKNYQKAIPIPSLAYEAQKIAHQLLGSRIDQRYLAIQQLCYSHHRNLVGCPWIVHFPRTCTDFKNQNPPLLNRVAFLITVEQNQQITLADYQKIDLEFWEFLVKEGLVKKQQSKWILETTRIQWYTSYEVKIEQIKKTESNIKLLWS